MVELLLAFWSAAIPSPLFHGEDTHRTQSGGPIPDWRLPPHSKTQARGLA
jgi:hypothetical protein